MLAQSPLMRCNSERGMLGGGILGQTARKIRWNRKDGEALVQKPMDRFGMLIKHSAWRGSRAQLFTRQPSVYRCGVQTSDQYNFLCLTYMCVNFPARNPRREIYLLSKCVFDILSMLYNAE